MTERDRFRFEGLTVWKKAVEVGEALLSLADDLEHRRLFKFADQMRGAALSISNNIAEGSGSTSDRDFRRFLDIARRSVFEDANMVTVFCRHGLISSAQRDGLLVALQEEARMLTGFMASLRRRIAARSLALCAFSITIALVVARLLQGV